MPETPEGVIQGPGNMSEILARRQLSCDLKFSNDEPGPLGHTDRNLLDPRMLHHMLKMEEVLHEQLSPIMFTYLQDQVTPRMRQDTLCWLYEVGLIFGLLLFLKFPLRHVSQCRDEGLSSLVEWGNSWGMNYVLDNMV